jgi:putative lipoprotein (rSAM/lipoprotein system)
MDIKIKTMDASQSKRKRNFWQAALGLFGFQSSKPVPAESGTPSATFEVNGKVINAQTERPIADIKLLMKQKFEYQDTSFVEQVDSATTNAQGAFRLKHTDVPEKTEYIILIIDADDEKNGLFEDHDTVISFENAQFKNGDNKWYKGEVSKSIEIKLKPLK